MTRVLVVSGSSITRAGLETLVAESPTLTLAGSLPDVDGAEFAGQIADSRPDVLLVDFQGRLSGKVQGHLEGRDEDALSQLRSLSTGEYCLAIVVLADDTQGLWTIEALHAGVRAVLPTAATMDEIVAAVEAAAAGFVILHPETVESMLSNAPLIQRDANGSTERDSLTSREIEVLGMIAEGLGNKTIAYRLGISEHTVKFHIGSIFGKLGAQSRTEAVTLGLRQGLIML